MAASWSVTESGRELGNSQDSSLKRQAYWWVGAPQATPRIEVLSRLVEGPGIYAYPTNQWAPPLVALSSGGAGIEAELSSPAQSAETDCYMSY